MFSLIVHHIRKFITSLVLHYKKGEKIYFSRSDSDRWSYFEAPMIVKEFNYNFEVKLWWKSKKGRMNKDLKQLCLDRDATKVNNYAEYRKKKV